MTSQFLPLYRNNAVDELEEANDQGDSAASYAQLLHRCGLHRTIAIAELLMSADTHAFRSGLRASADTFAAGLARTPPTSVIVSRAAPLLDALAVGATDSARSIARYLTGKVWQRDYEYQEDHYYFNCLVALALGDTQRARQRLWDWDDECADEDDGRFTVMQAWLGNDEADFEDALDLLLRQREEYCDTMREAGGLPQRILDTEGRVYVEGMMWVELGRQRGFADEADYLFVPSVMFEEDAAPAQAGRG